MENPDTNNDIKEILNVQTPHLTHLTLPDGSLYDISIFKMPEEGPSKAFYKDYWLTQIEMLLENNKGKDPIRIIFSVGVKEVCGIFELINGLKILNRFSSIETIDFWDTKYFNLPFNKIESLLETEEHSDLKWGNYENDFDISLISPSEREDMFIFLRLLQQSFGVTFKDGNVFANNEIRSKIGSNFQRSLSSDVIKNYMIKSKEGKYLGSFTLVQLPDGEVQLHSVAGRSTPNDPSIMQYKGKIKVILAGLLKTLADPKFSGQERLTFTSNKRPVIDMYRNNGISVDVNRSGLIIHRK